MEYERWQIGRYSISILGNRKFLEDVTARWDELVKAETQRDEWKQRHADDVIELVRQRDEWRKSCILAKKQRDRALLKVNEYIAKVDDPPWHPDWDGPYA